MIQTRPGAIYALYKGDDLLAQGTISDISEQTGIAYDVVLHYKTPTYRNKIKTGSNRRRLVFVSEGEYGKLNEFGVLKGKNAQEKLFSYLKIKKTKWTELAETVGITKFDIYNMKDKGTKMPIDVFLKICFEKDIDPRNFMEVE